MKSLMSGCGIVIMAVKAARIAVDATPRLTSLPDDDLKIIVADAVTAIVVVLVVMIMVFLTCVDEDGYGDGINTHIINIILVIIIAFNLPVTLAIIYSIGKLLKIYNPSQRIQNTKGPDVRERTCMASIHSSFLFRFVPCISCRFAVKHPFSRSLKHFPCLLPVRLEVRLFVCDLHYACMRGAPSSAEGTTYCLSFFVPLLVILNPRQKGFNVILFLALFV